MRKLLKAQWILGFNTLPILLLLFLKISEHQIIKSLLSEEQIWYRQTFALVLIFLALLSLTYALVSIYRNRSVSLAYALSSLLAYIGFCYLYYFNIDNLDGWNIPRWMVDDFSPVYVGSFLMPSLVHALLVIVLRLSPEDKKVSPALNFGFAILIPVLAYAFVELILPLWKPTNHYFAEHAIVVLAIIGTLLFFFFLFRSLFVILRTKGHWKKYRLVWEIPFALLLPLLGLAVNTGFIIEEWRLGDLHILGNYSSLWYPGLVVLNATLIFLPNFGNPHLRLLRFIGSSALLAFTSYFFIVFIPFLPFAVVAIIAFGLGFLLLSPIFLFTIQSLKLSQDFRFLKNHFSKTKLRLMAAAAFLIIPLGLSYNYYQERITLHQALDYLYSPSYTEQEPIETDHLKASLNELASQKYNRSISGLFGYQTPYLSRYYNWLVLDNLTISDSKINAIARVFLNEGSSLQENSQNGNTEVQLSEVKLESTYHEDGEYWTSWLNLEITNPSKRRNIEYATAFDLPHGCYISDYYLYVGDRKEMGILAEKKSAMWIYSQIRDYRKDPGLLYYLNAHQIGFRVYPFAEHELRRTGIQFTHKEPLEINFDGHSLKLGHDSIASGNSFENEQVAYISVSDKSQLAEIKRKPYFHFIADYSSGPNPKYKSAISELQTAQPKLMEGAKISLVNSQLKTYNVKDDWSEPLNSQGGFFLDRAIRESLVKHYMKVEERYPIFVVLSDSLEKAVLFKDFRDLEFCFPEGPRFYHYTDDAKLVPHSLTSNPLQALEDSIGFKAFNSVLRFQDDAGKPYFLNSNSEPSLVVKKQGLNNLKLQSSPNKWLAALVMEAEYRNHLVNPQYGDEHWLPLLKESFKNQIMNPYSSFLVVENEAQKEMLKKKQAEVMSGAKNLDAGEESLPMSEPQWYILALLMSLFIWWRSRRKAIPE